MTYMVLILAKKRNTDLYAHEIIAFSNAPNKETLELADDKRTKIP